ncbi:hypothetical protein ACVOMV_31235 [Mesorhizobium atlanticum]
MTKNLGNAKPSAPAKEISASLFSRAAPALFPWWSRRSAISSAGIISAFDARPASGGFPV